MIVKKLLCLSCFFMVGLAELGKAQTYQGRAVPPGPGAYYQLQPYRPTPTPRTSGSDRSARSGAPLAIDRPTLLQSPGSFTLAGNIGAETDATTAAIVIAAPDVTLDLGGYTISSRGATDGNAGGIAIMADRVTVRNGNVQGFDSENQYGVAVGAGVRSFTLEHLKIGDCDSGILLNPDDLESLPVSGGSISHVQVSGGAVGILAFESEAVALADSIVTGATAKRPIEGEGSGALLRGTAYTVRNCSFTANAHGLRIDADFSTIEDCSFTRNRNTGVYLRGTGGVLRDCTLSGNGITGAVVVGSGCSISDSSFHGNGGHGITLDTANDEFAAEYSSLHQCRFTANAGAGVADKGRGSTAVSACFVAGNSGAGLDLLAGSIYKDCILSGSGGQVRGGVDGGGNARLPAR